MFEDFESEEEIIGWLEDQGALTIEGVDESGEIVLRMIPEKMKQVFPELYYDMRKEIDMALWELYEMGYVRVSYDEDLNPSFSITEEGKKIMEKYGYGGETKHD